MGPLGVRVRVAVVVRVTVSLLTPALSEEGEANPGYGQTRDATEPRVQAVWHHVAGGVERHRAEQEDPGRVGDRDREPEEDGVPRGTPRSNEIGGDNGLAMARLERVKRTQHHSRGHREQEERWAHVVSGHQIGEGAARAGAAARVEPE